MRALVEATKEAQLDVMIRGVYTYIRDVHQASSFPHRPPQAVLKLRMAIPRNKVCGLRNLHTS